MKKTTKPPRAAKRIKTPLTQATALVLRTCAADLTSYGGFRWPASGPVECPDWSSVAECGNGLHGLLWGEGDGSLLSWEPAAKWLVVEVEAATVVEIGRKVKFPRGLVVFCGDRSSAIEYIAARAPADKIVVGRTAIVADHGSLIGGYASTVTGGARSKVTGGDASTVTGGYASTVTGGARSKVTGGYASTVTGGYASTVTGGARSKVTGGDASTVTGGHASTVTGGDNSILQLRWWDGKRYRIATFYVGEDGIEAGVAYMCENGKAIRVSP